MRNGETEDDCEDPERLVMFDDVSAFLFQIQSVNNKFQLLMNFMSLLEEKRKENCFVSSFPSLSDLYRKSEQYDMESWDDIGQTYMLDSSDCCPPVRKSVQKKNKFIDSCLSQAAARFTGTHKARLTYRWILHKVKIVNSNLVDLQKDQKTWKSTCKEVRKWIKEILKEEANRNNILLWEAYICAEEVIGSREDVARVTDTVLSMSLQCGGVLGLKDYTTQCEIFQLCRMSVEMDLGMRNQGRKESQCKDKGERSLHVLTSLLNTDPYKPFQSGSKVHPTKILKARRGYSQLVQEFQQLETDHQETVMTGQPEAGSALVHCVACYAYFQYLTEGIHAASVVFQQVREILLFCCEERQICLSVPVNMHILQLAYRTLTCCFSALIASGHSTRAWQRHNMTSSIANVSTHKK